MSKTVRVSLPLLSSVYFIIFICWLSYRYFTRNTDLIDEFIAKPIIWVAPVLVVSLLKNLRLSELGFRKLSLKSFSLALVTGIVLSALQFLPAYFQFHKLFFLPANFLIVTVATLGTALSEEILFRGFIFKQLSNYYSIVTNTTVTSILFALIHLPIFIFIQHSAGVSLLTSLYLVFLSSIAFCLLYAYTKNIWSSIIAHFLFDTLLLLF